jgi:5-formyltetrahydrofolate cyclo-ligase
MPKNESEMPKGDADKQRVRDEIWTRFEDSGEALFPGARGRIPNFRGAAAAADRLAATPEWRRAKVLKCNPDAPQRPVRLRALREGKVVYMACRASLRRSASGGSTRRGSIRASNPRRRRSAAPRSSAGWSGLASCPTST